MKSNIGRKLWIIVVIIVTLCLSDSFDYVIWEDLVSSIIPEELMVIEATSEKEPVMNFGNEADNESIFYRLDQNNGEIIQTEKYLFHIVSGERYDVWTSMPIHDKQIIIDSDGFGIENPVFGSNEAYLADYEPETEKTKGFDGKLPLSQGYNVKEAGAIGDSMTDDTDAIQSALDDHDSVYIPEGIYLIDIDKALQLNDNQILVLSDKAILKAKPTATGFNNVIYIDGRDNVVVTGGRIVGDRHEHLGSTGEWGHGIFVRGGATNIHISHMHISDCWGDAIEIGDTEGMPPAEGVTIDNIVADGNRRQGLSITNAVNVVVRNSVFKNTNGTLPEAGIDIEPNKGCVTEDILIENVHCYGNQGVGIDLAGFFDYESFKNVTIVDTIVENNGYAGFRLYNTEFVYIADSISRGNFYYGLEVPYDVHHATFKRVTFTENNDRGVSLVTYSQTTGLSNLNFVDCEFPITVRRMQHLQTALE